MLNNLNKKTKNLIIAISSILILGILITIIISVSNGQKNPEGKEIANQYEELNDKISKDGRKYPEVNISSKNIIKYITIEEIIDILNNNTDDAVIYFGTPTSIYSRRAIQILMDTVKKTDLDVMYYLNLDETDIEYNNLVSVLGEELTELENNERKVPNPLVIFITDGEVISYNKGTLFSHEDPYKELDSSQKAGLSEIYKLGIDTVVSSKNLKKSIKTK